jgi:hypothetical protein
MARQAATTVVGVAAIATLLLPAMPALAVSGGGGECALDIFVTAVLVGSFVLCVCIMSAPVVAGGGNSLAFQDLSGQDLRKNKYLKADLRGANLR